MQESQVPEKCRVSVHLRKERMGWKDGSDGRKGVAVRNRLLVWLRNAGSFADA